MRARAALRAEADSGGRTRLTVLRSQAPLILRPAADAVYLASGAGGPMGGDDLELSIEVGPHARLTLRTVGAAVVLPGRGESRMTVRLSVAAGASLAVLPEPTVVVTGARHRAVVEAEVEDGGALIVREEVLLGRHGETGGAYRGLLRVDYAGTPLLRHELVLDGADPHTAARASVTGARACGSLLITGQAAETRAPDPSVATLRLAGPGTLVTAVADDAHVLRQRLDGAALAHCAV